MLDLYDEMFSLINPIVTSYSDHYPTDKEAEDGHKIYPYAEFSFPNTMPNNEWSNNFLLSVDVWDNKSGIVKEIETLTDSIYQALNKKLINYGSKFIQINRNSPCILSLPDPELNIQRRQLRFILKVYPA